MPVLENLGFVVESPVAGTDVDWLQGIHVQTSYAFHLLEARFCARIMCPNWEQNKHQHQCPFHSMTLPNHLILGESQTFWGIDIASVCPSCTW